MEGISVVVPLYNEEDNVAAVYGEIREVMEGLPAHGIEVPYEIIFVDDGSRDKTLQNALQVVGADPNVKIIQFRRNFGQTAAMAAGFEHTQYDIVVSLDGDLQNDPREIPRMYRVVQEGNDLVAGWRKDRKDKFLSRRLPSLIANRIIAKSTGVDLHDYGCTLKMMRGDIARGLRLYGEMHRFIPALANEMGAKIVEMPVNHRERQFGTSKYGISRTIRVVLDLMTVKFLLGFSKRPIHLFGSLGILTSLLGTMILAIISYQRLFLSVPMGNRPMMSLGVLLFIVGLQFFVFGLLAEMLARTYYESQDKRTYVIRQVFVGGQANESNHNTATVNRATESRSGAVANL